MEDDLALHLLLGSLIADPSLLDVSTFQRKCLSERHIMQLRAFKQRMQLPFAKPALHKRKLIEFELASIQQLPIHLIILLRRNNRLLKLHLTHLINNRIIQRLDVIIKLLTE